MRSATKIAAALIASFLGVGAVAGCSSASDSTQSPSQNQTIRVAAAASLTDVFTELAKDFESANPGTKIELDFGSSTTLAQQLSQRTDVSLYASADEKSMKTATDSGAAHNPAKLAINRLVIAVPEGNPGKITSLADFVDPAKTVVLCDATAPCGRASTRVLAAAKLPEPARANRQPDVRATLGVIRSGEADAGLVYKTDAEAAKNQVDEIALSTELGDAADTEYFLAPVGEDLPETAQKFQHFVMGPEGAAALVRAGFIAPVR